MNKDQIKGTGKDVAGKVQEGAGKLVGSTEQTGASTNDTRHLD